MSEAKLNPNDLFDPYNVRIGGVKADPYRIARAYGLGGAEAQALKKLLRMGTKHKSRAEDAKEVITTMQRVIEMDEEDSRSNRDKLGDHTHDSTNLTLC